MNILEFVIFAITYLLFILLFALIVHSLGELKRFRSDLEKLKGDLANFSLMKELQQNIFCRVLRLEMRSRHREVWEAAEGDSEKLSSDPSRIKDIQHSIARLESIVGIKNGKVIEGGWIAKRMMRCPDSETDEFLERRVREIMEAEEMNTNSGFAAEEESV